MKPVEQQTSPDQMHGAIVEEMRQAYRRAYKYTYPYWLKAIAYSDAYEALIDPNNWPTMSDVVFPHRFVAVENKLQFLWNYAIPEDKLFELSPRREHIPYEAVRRAEAFFMHGLMKKGQLRKEGFLALKDISKLGTGYLRARVGSESVKSDRLLVAYKDGVRKADRQLIEQESKPCVVIEHVPFGQVLSMGNGDNPQNGEHVIVSFVQAADLKKLYDEDMKQDDRDWLTSASADDIILEARENNIDSSVVPNGELMARLASDTQVPTKDQSLQGLSSVMVPLVEFHLHGRKAVLANGRHVIFYQESDKPMTSGLCMGKSCPNSGSWFGGTDITNAMGLEFGSNVLHNAVIDLLSQALYPARVVNTSQLVDGRNIPAHGPYATYEIHGGRAQDAIHFPQTPPPPAGTFEVAATLQQLHAQTTGQPLSSQGQGSAGLVRSGVTAFESLMSSTHGREKMEGALQELQLIEPLIGEYIRLSQLIFGDEETFITKEIPEGLTEESYRELGGKHVAVSVTRADVINDWDFELDMQAKQKQNMSDLNRDMAIYDRFKDDPNVDQEALKDHLIRDPQLSRRLRATPEQRNQNLQQRQQLNQIDGQGGAGQGGPPQLPQAQGDIGALLGGAGQ